MSCIELRNADGERNSGGTLASGLFADRVAVRLVNTGVYNLQAGLPVQNSL
jgi:hypothetical protein